MKDYKKVIEILREEQQKTREKNKTEPYLLNIRKNHGYIDGLHTAIAYILDEFEEK